MSIFSVVVIVLGVVVFLAIISWVLIKKLMEPNAKPLTEEDLKICERIVSERKGYPFVCKWALKHKKCPCLPCKRLENAKLEFG